MRVLLLSIALLLTTQAYAVNTGSSKAITIKSINFYSKQETIYPGWAGTVQVIFDSITWTNGGDCETTNVAVRNEDSHLISAIIAASMSKTPIRLYADTNVKVDGSRCYLRAVGY